MRFAVLAFSVVTLAACSTTTKLTEIRSTPSLAKYADASVTVTARNPALESASEHVGICRAEIPAALLQRGIFGRVVGDDAPLLVAVVLTETEEMSSDRGEQVIINLEVAIRDRAKPDPIGQLQILATSADAASDRYRAACRNAATTLAKYLGKRR